MSEKQTMTLNLSIREMEGLEKLSFEMDMTKTAVMRSALRLYQYIHIRLQNGERFMFSGDEQRTIEFIGPGFGERND